MKTLLRKHTPFAAFSILAVLVAVGLWLIFAYLDKVQERDSRNWQTVLGVMADARLQSVDTWLETQQGTLRELSGNASLQLYLTQISAAGKEAADSAIAAQTGYLRNLIVATAERGSFSSPEMQPRVQANIPSRPGNSLALLNRHGAVVTATSGFTLPAALAGAVAQSMKNGKAATLMFALDSGEAAIGFVMPVPALQGTGGENTIGSVVGVKLAQAELFPMLTRRISAYRSEEAVLASREGNSVTYLSPLSDGSAPMRKRLASSTPNLAEAHALQAPGEFSATKLDYQGVNVLMTSRAFRQVPWVLVEKISSNEALAESRAHRKFLLTAFILTMALVAAALVAAWWYGSSTKERKTAEQLRIKSRELEKQSGLLKGISNNSPDLILIADDNQRFVFANQALADAVNMKQEDFSGKSMSSVFGTQAAHNLSQLITQALKNSSQQAALETMEIGNRQGIFHTTVVPLKLEHGEIHSVLSVSRDMTELQRSQEKHAALMKNLIRTLMHAVDLYDPYSADHSNKTIRVALAIGEHMHLNKSDLEVLEMAANLANIGKLGVPREILIKTEPLTPDEQDTLRKHAMYAVELLTDLEFEGPVLETIEQRYEHIDGSGYPAGRQGEHILLTAKILAVANAFVAMASSRAYRGSMNVEQVLDQLLTETKSKYDRHVVAALFHVAENHPDSISVG